MSMHHYAIYETDTGKVLSVGRSSNRRVIVLARKALAEGQSLYVGEIDPNTTFLPGGVPTPKPEEVRVVTPLEVKAHAGRLLSYTDWVVVKALDTGKPADPAILAKRQAIRDASNALEAMDPIPADFIDPKYWP
jgi:hypothetical protein